MKQKLNGLVITYCYPPYESPESLVTFKLVNSMGKRSNITILRPNFWNNGKNFVYFKNKRINEIKVDIPKYIQKILEIKRLPIRPDRFLLFYPFFIRELKKMNINKFDFFMTRSQFHTSHLLGLYLKKNYNLPWYAHFSDPWYDNPVQKRIPFFDSLSLRMQRKVISGSDFNSFPLKELRDYFSIQNKFNIKSKSIVIPHTLNKVSSQKIKLKKNVIRFFGKIYAGRKVKNSLIAITNLINDNIKISSEFFVDDDFFLNYPHLIKKFNQIKFFRYLSYDKYLKKLKSSSALILIDIDEDYGNLFFQSKLVDYLESLRPILHIGKTTTYNKKIILKSNGMSCHNDPVQIYQSLKMLLANLDKYSPDKKILESFSSDKVSLNLINHIKKNLK